jgi:hypothetical protein
LYLLLRYVIIYIENNLERVIYLNEKETMKNYFETINTLKDKGKTKEILKLQKKYRDYKEFQCNKEVLFLEEIIKKSKWNIRYGTTKNVFIINCNENIEYCVYWLNTRVMTSFINTKPRSKELNNNDCVSDSSIADGNKEEFLKLIEEFKKENENNGN